MSKFQIVPQKESVAVWSITPELIHGAVLEVDVGKHVRVVREWKRPRGAKHKDKMSREFLDALRHTPVVVSLDSRLAYTAIVPLALHLKNEQREDRLEFQSAVREIVNRANLETRLIAARALGIEDLDAVLFDARVVGLKVDGKDVAGWPQLTGKKLTGAVHLMFTPRDVFEELHALRHSKKELFITEDSKAALTALERYVGGPLRVMRTDLGHSELTVLDYRNESVFRKLPFEWESPLKMLMEEWAISENAARGVLGRISGDVSPQARRFFEKIGERSADSFHKALQRSKFRGTIYVRGTDVLPFALPYGHEGISLEPYPFREMWEAFGFEGEMDPSETSLSTLLPFLEYHYHRGDPAHHRVLTRQIHWIAE